MSRRQEQPNTNGNDLAQELHREYLVHLVEK